MFSSFFKKDPLAELREQAEILHRHAHKVWCYRRDVIADADAGELRSSDKELARIAGDKNAGENELKNAIEKLDGILRRVGGSVYPSRMIPEWVELVVVAAIIAGGVRSFFLQPFKIPTNSMYPTYHGMTAQVYPLDKDGPAGLEKIFLKVTQWANRVDARTRIAGEVEIPLDRSLSPAKLPPVPDGGFFGTGILEGRSEVYYVTVGDERVPIPVPQDFSITGVFLKTYFQADAHPNLSEPARWREAIVNANKRGDLRQLPNGQYALRTRHKVDAGGRIANFDILTGDMVLVDRMSYNFIAPKIGDPFVFATKKIEGLNRNGLPIDQYYIKRLVGLPGDTLCVSARTLMRNNAPITGKPAFEKNNNFRTEEEYFGYQPAAGDSGLYGLEHPRTIPEHHYFAMGDNSSNSWDSRGWGYVPDDQVIGRALFILYPFTNRWGLAE